MRRRIRRDVGIAVHGEAAQEVARVVEDPVVARDLAVHVPLSEWRVPGRAGRRRDDQRHLAAAHDEQDLPRLVDLDVVAGVPRGRDPRHEQSSPDGVIGNAGAWKISDLLEREQRVGVVLAEDAVLPHCEVQCCEAGFERANARAAAPDREARLHDRDGERLGDGGPSCGRARADEHVRDVSRAGVDHVRGKHRAGHRRVQRRDDVNRRSDERRTTCRDRELWNDDRGCARRDTEGTRNERPWAENADAERAMLEPSPVVRHRDARHDRRAHRDVLRVADAARQRDGQGDRCHRPDLLGAGVGGERRPPRAGGVHVLHRAAACGRPVAQVPGVRRGLALRGQRNGQRRPARERRRRDATAGVRCRCERERRDSGEDKAAHLVEASCRW